jgi:hypothetical protein
MLKFSGTFWRWRPIVLASRAILLATAGGYGLASSPSSSSGELPGETVVRIHFVGSAATYSSWLTLSKTGEMSKVDYKVDDGMTAIPRPKSIVPTVPWQMIWDQFSAQRFYELQGDGRDPGCPAKTKQVLDAETVSVEVRRGNDNRKFAYSYPPYASCGGTQRLTDVLAFLQKAFGNVFPVPK